MVSPRAQSSLTRLNHVTWTKTVTIRRHSLLSSPLSLSGSGVYAHILPHPITTFSEMSIGTAAMGANASLIFGATVKVVARLFFSIIATQSLRSHTTSSRWVAAAPGRLDPQLVRRMNSLAKDCQMFRRLKRRQQPTILSILRLRLLPKIHLHLTLWIIHFLKLLVQTLLFLRQRRCQSTPKQSSSSHM